MRKVDSFTLKLFLLTPKEASSHAKIYLRITVDRKKAEIYTGYTVLIENWDDIRQQSRSKQDSAINEDLIDIKNRIISIKRRLQYEDKPLSAKLIKDIYTGASSVNKFLLEYFNEHIQQIDRLNKEYSKGTVSNYRTTAKHLQAFLISRTLKDIPIIDVDYKFVSDFDFFLKTITNVMTKKSMDRNTANKQHQRLKTVLLKAIREGYLEKNPYQSLKLKNNKTNRDFLTEEELEILQSHPLGNNNSLEKVKDIFLFSVYTGLRFGDATHLKISHIRKDKEGKYWIEKVPNKTEEILRIPMLKPAVDIMNKYNDKERSITGYILPRISHQKVNTYLKTIADLTGIQKHLTHHVARHTFATTITLSNEVPIEIVSKLLGHTSIKTTQIYAKIQVKALAETRSKLDKKY